jgi:hypothetical protein
LEALLTDHWVVADQLQRRLDELARGEGLPGRHPLQVTGLDLRTSSTNREGIICRVAAIVNFHCQYHRGLQAVLDQLNALVGGSIRIERDGGGRSPQKQHITLETFFASGGRALPLGRLFDGTIY